MRTLAIALLCISPAISQPVEDPRDPKAREEAIRQGLAAQDYVDAKRDYETDQELLRTLKLKRNTIKPGQDGFDELEAAIRQQKSIVNVRLKQLIRIARKINLQPAPTADGAIAPFFEGIAVLGEQNKPLDPNDPKRAKIQMDEAGRAALTYLEFKFKGRKAAATPEQQLQEMKQSVELRSKLDQLIHYPRRKVTSNPLFEAAAFPKKPKAERELLLMEISVRNVIARNIGAASLQLESEFAILEAVQTWQNSNPEGFNERLDKVTQQQREHIRNMANDFDQLCEDHGVTTSTPDDKSLHITFTKRLWEE